MTKMLSSYLKIAIFVGHGCVESETTVITDS